MCLHPGKRVGTRVYFPARHPNYRKRTLSSTRPGGILHDARLAERLVPGNNMATNGFRGWLSLFIFVAGIYYRVLNILADSSADYPDPGHSSQHA